MSALVSRLEVDEVTRGDAESRDFNIYIWQIAEGYIYRTKGILEDKKDDPSYHEENSRQEGNDENPSSIERPSRVGEHNVDLMLEALAHSRERELAEYSVPSRRRHTVDIGLGHLVQHVVDDGCPVRDVICITQPACLALDDCL